MPVKLERTAGNFLQATGHAVQLWGNIQRSKVSADDRVVEEQAVHLVLVQAITCREPGGHVAVSSGPPTSDQVAAVDVGIAYLS
jgi:hypothetical protein